MNVNYSVIGKTANGLAIPGFHFSAGGTARVLMLGAVHGDEPEGAVATHALLNQFYTTFKYSLELLLIPILNLDGVLAGTRVNAKGVDLNRNLPTKDWTPEIQNPRYPPGPSPASEPENQALVRIIEQFMPGFIISFHSFHKFLLNTNGACEEFARAIQKRTQYPIAPHIGYPTPGSLGTYAAVERSIPTLTYELERGMPPEKIVKLHVPAVLDALYLFEKI